MLRDPGPPGDLRHDALARAGASGTLDVGFNFERLLTDGNRLYASRAQTRAFDLTSLENPVQLYHWNEALLLVEGGVGFTLGFNASDPSLREIRTWDMTPSKGPALLGSTVFEGVPNRVYAYEGLVYIATTTGVNIIDASDAATPEVIASDHSIGDVRTMGFAPDLMYALVGNEVRVFNSRRTCNPADLAAPFGVLDLTDILAFIDGFSTMDSMSDFAAPEGVFDLADIQAFVIAFNSSCP